MVAVIKPDIGGPANTTSVPDATPATERIKKFFEDKDWKFYAAVFAGVAVAGAGAYYLTSSNKKKPSNKKNSAGEPTGKGKDTASTSIGKLGGLLSPHSWLDPADLFAI